MKIKKGLKISYTNIIKVFKIASVLLSLSIIVMIFFVSSKNDFENSSLVETKDLNIGSEGNSFQIDSAQLSGLNKLGNSFNIKADKINQIDNKLPIISGDEIAGRINLSSEIIKKEEILQKTITEIKTNRGGKITHQKPGQLDVNNVNNLNKKKKHIISVW